MEAAGTILGATSLGLQVLNACLKGYDVISDATSMPDDLRYLTVQLRIERSRLRDFGQAAELTENVDERTLSRGIQANKQVIISVLKEIKIVLDEFSGGSTQNANPYAGVQSTSSQNSDQMNLGTLYNSLDSSENGQSGIEKRPLGVVNKFKWSLAHKDDFVQLLRRLRRSNNYLHELLNKEQTQKLQDRQQSTYMELVQVRDSVRDLEILAEAAQAFRRSPYETGGWQQKVDLELENLAAFKAFYGSLLERTVSNTSNLKIDVEHIQFEHTLNLADPNPEAKYVNGAGEPKIVWINWQNQPPDDDAHRELSPIEELTALLMAPKPAEFCVPRCLGYCNDLAEEAWRPGLIFEYPPCIEPGSRPISLLSAIEELSKPSLTRRIALAYKLAQCLLYLHSVNWLHKALRSDNIFLTPLSMDEYDITSPYVTGFDYSRRARFNEATIEVPRVGRMEVYRHPDNQVNGPRMSYRKTFDIYSLGIILIEIAHWKPIAKILGIERTIDVSPRAANNVQKRLLSSEPVLLQMLQGEVGEKYADAVKACIAARDSFDVKRLDEETSVSTAISIQQGFNAQVVRVLREIAV